MVYFRRLLKYVFAQKVSVFVAIVAAGLTAALMAVNVTAVMPVIQMMLDDSGLHGWAEGRIVSKRSGIVFLVEEAKELEDGVMSCPQPLMVTKIERTSDVGNSLSVGDQIFNAWPEEPSDITGVPVQSAVELIAYLAASDKEQIWLRVRHVDGKEAIVAYSPGVKPFWIEWALSLLDRIPRGQGVDYKFRCISVMLWLTLILALVRCVCRFTHEFTVRKISLTSIRNLRNDTFARAIRLPLGVYTQEGVSDTISRFINDTNLVSRGITVLFGKAMVEPLKIVSCFIMAYMIDKQITLIVLASSPLVFLLVLKIGKKSKKATKHSLQKWSALLGKLQESFLGIKVIKGYHQESWETDRFRNANQDLYSRQIRMARVEASSSPSIEAVAFTGACIGFMFALRMIQGSDMNPSGFIILVALLATAAESGRKLGDILPQVQEANASAQRVFELYDREIEADHPDAVQLAPLHKDMEFCDVWFKYPGSVEHNLKGVNLKVKAGDTVAIVGPNGSGKTTLLSMIPRFFELEKGQILIDGIDISRATIESLRGQLGIVTQNTIVFNDTIANNIAYGRPGTDIETIKEAARHAYAEEFILEKAKGYDELIGQQGATLSGGQLQRLAIARAILRNPSILIFDEATSQIDSDSEAKIQRALKEFCKGRTAFIIAHRLSTIVDADVIVVMDKGQIAACGSHNELLESCQLYRTLYETQFGSRDA